MTLLNDAVNSCKWVPESPTTYLSYSLKTFARERLTYRSHSYVSLSQPLREKFR